MIAYHPAMQTAWQLLTVGLSIDPPVPLLSVLAGILGTENGTWAVCTPFLEREGVVPFCKLFRTDRHTQNCLKGQLFRLLVLRGRPVRSRFGLLGTGTENGHYRPELDDP